MTMVSRRFQHRPFQKPTQPKARQFVASEHRVVTDVSGVDIVGLDGMRLTQESHILSNPGKLAWFRISIVLPGDVTHKANVYDPGKFIFDQKPPRVIVTQLNKYWYPVFESYISAGATGAWDFDLSTFDRDYMASRLADYVKL